MRRFSAVIIGCSVLTLGTACAGAPRQASHHDPATGRAQRHSLVQGAVAGKNRTGLHMPSSGGQPRGNWPLPVRLSCTGHPPVAEASDPLPCTPMLLVPIVVRHPRDGQPRIVYVRKPCFCASGG